MRLTTRWLAWPALIALVVTPAPSAAQTFRDRAEVVVVEVPIQVIKDGKPVRGLTAADFEILDGRKREEITGFEVVDLTQIGEAAVPQAALPKAARRHFLILFDLSFSDPNAIYRAREAAASLVRDEMHPTDLAAVASFSLQQGPRLVLGFTSDRSQLERAIESLGLPQLIEQSGDPLQLTITPPATGVQGPGAGGVAGVDREALVQDHLASLSLLNERSQLQVDRGRIVQFARSFTNLAGLMRAVQGRKYVLLLSEGFDMTALFGTEDIAKTMEMNRAAEAGQYWEVDSQQRFGTTEDTSVLMDMLEEFRRSDSVIQAIDIGGLRADGVRRAQSEDSLFLFANETGGEMYRGFNDLSAAMDQLLERTSVTYILAFQPKKLELDGAYHPIKVKLKGGPSGARLVHRPGYYAPEPYAARSGAERQLAAADAIMGGPEGGRIGTSVLATPIPVTGGPAYVPVLIEINGTDLLAGASGENVVTELYAYALSSTGEVRDFFSQTMGLDLAKVEAGLRQGGIKYYGHLDLDPGEYVVRVLVRNAETGASTLRALPLTVPAGEPGLSLPLVPEPMGKWLIVREPASAVDRQVEYPFMLHGQPYVPAARPVIAAGGSAELVLLGYNLDDPGLDLETWVLSADGQRIDGPTVRLTENRPTTTGAHQLVAQFDAKGLTAGTYTLVIAVRGTDVSGSISIEVPG